MPEMEFPLDWSNDVRLRHEQLRRGEIESLETSLQAIDDLEWHYQVLESLAWRSTKTAHLRRWHEQEPSSTPAALALVLHLVQQAYDERRWSASEEERTKAQALFSERVEAAEAILAPVRAREPNDAEVAAVALTLARAAEDLPAIREIWEQAYAAHPDFAPLLIEYLTCLSPRFFGTEGDLLGFARTMATEAPVGSFRVVLPLLAHAEIVVMHLSRLRETRSFTAVTDPYFQQYAVRMDLLYAAECYLGPNPAEWALRDVRALNYLLFALALAREPIRPLTAAIAGRYTVLPWAWLGDSQEVFESFERQGRRRWRGPRSIALFDRRAFDIVHGNLSALGMIAIACFLLYLTLPDALFSAKADRSQKLVMKVDWVEAKEVGIATRYTAHGMVGDQQGVVRTGKKEYGRSKYELVVHPVRGERNAFLRAEDHPGGPLLLHTPWVDVTLGVLMSVLILFFALFLLLVRTPREIATREGRTAEQ